MLIWVEPEKTFYNLEAWLFQQIFIYTFVHAINRALLPKGNLHVQAELTIPFGNVYLFTF